MSDILKFIQERQSTRASFDPNRQVDKEKVKKIIEAGRWTPSAHNMQNFEIIVVDDKKVLEKIGKIKSLVSEAFIRENYEQLSFSEEELLKKKVGILGTNFPATWRNATKLDQAVRERTLSNLSYSIKGSPTILIVTYDSRKRAPASEGDVLGILSLGAMMENMWLMAQSLGIGFQIMSVFNGESVEKELKKMLNIPEDMKISFAVRLGYSESKPAKYLRVRRNIEMFTHYNKF